MVAPIAQNVNNPDDSPALKLAQAGADVGPGDGKGEGDLLRIERFGGDVQQSVDLSHRPVDPPARAHLAPVENELLHDGRKRDHNSFISVTTELSYTLGGLSSLFEAFFPLPAPKGAVGPARCEAA